MPANAGIQKGRGGLPVPFAPFDKLSEETCPLGACAVLIRWRTVTSAISLRLRPCGIMESWQDRA